MNTVFLEQLLGLFLQGVATVLPWFLGGGVLLLAAAASPLGRELVRYLRSRHQDFVLTKEVAAEIAHLRALLTEAIDRIDASGKQALPPADPFHEEPIHQKLEGTKSSKKID